MDHSRLLLHTTRIPVRWGDMDALGHVNNTVYFRYMEQARVEWLDTLGLAVEPGREEGVVIVSASCTFLVPVTYPATVEVQLFAGHPGRSSIPTYYRMYCVGEETLYAEGEAKVVWISGVTGKSTPLPESIRARLVAR
jgi:acyl-CoA thioester hydrolase